MTKPINHGVEADIRQFFDCVAHSAAETDGTLSVLRDQREHGFDQTIPGDRGSAGAEVAQLEKSAADIL
ncbi:MAG: hypothetical protein KKE37_04740 [Verrucomicrobia bacterium]|nr:hypothetical protein [Verrucomicrobiota bacterium]MBU4291000.1 hypothetical protein [Verrucomicrobiota bacterium]MBU4428645.1 hypothetical protein [Verrucomicrobiota bacterium]MCG2680871.1 hypothetical protein [Kiritimatiellia bacterium]